MGILTLTKMKLLTILAFSTGAFAQYNTCTNTARCDYQCSNAFLASESCSGNRADLACCTETEACDLVNGSLTCTDLPYLDNTGAARTYVCCGGSDDTEDDTGNGSSGNSTTEATDVTTASDTDSSAIKIGSSLLALFLANLF